MVWSPLASPGLRFMDVCWGSLAQAPSNELSGSEVYCQSMFCVLRNVGSYFGFGPFLNFLGLGKTQIG